jgi:hypothetical protein
MGERAIKITVLIGVLLHLILVTLGAAYIHIPSWLPGHKILDFYAVASGADSNYGFFTPSFGSKTRIVFDIVEPSGRLENITLAPPSEREVQTRLGAIFDEFVGDDRDFRKELGASLAAAMFSRYSQASEVILRVQEFWPERMQDYRAGLRPDWSEYYVARFAKEQPQDKEMH